MDASCRALCLAALFACAARQKPSLKGAQADLQAGRAELAQREFEQILEDDPLDVHAIRGRIEAARKAGNLGAVRRSLKPGDAFAWYAIGLAAFADGDEREAISALRKAVEMRPDVADIQYRLGVVLLDGEKFAEAREPLTKAMQLGPGIARFRPPLAACLGRLGERKAALDALRDYARLQPQPVAEEAAKAVQVARSLTDLFRDLPPPSRSELEQALGYLSRDAPGLAVPPLEALLARLPDLAPAHALLGLAAARLDEAGRAVTELRRAAELAPDLPQPHAWLAELYAAKDKPETAAAEYALAIERNPLDAESLRRLGLLRLERALPGALDPLQQAAVLKPDDDALQLQLARAEIASGAAVPAKARLERLSQRRPEDAEVLLRLAMLLFDERAKAPDPDRGDLTRRVEKLLERVLSLQPENAAANRLLSALRAG
jgi:tetratricopeptide (TPR) repeat protein